MAVEAELPPPAADRGSTCMPREARWIALMMSRPWVSFEMQAVAPNESSWLDSAAVGRLASTTMRVVRVRLVELVDLGRSAQGSEVDHEHLWLVLGDLLFDLGRRHVVDHEREVLVLLDQLGEADRHEILEFADRDCYWLGHCRAGL